MPVKAKIFLQDANGYVVHAEIETEDNPKVTPAAQVREAIDDFVNYDFVPHAGWGSAMPGKPVQKDAEVRVTGSQQKKAAHCPECGGEMWDNRAKKKSGDYKKNAPDFACKDDNEHKWVVEGGKLVPHFSMKQANDSVYADDEMPFQE